VTFTQFWLGIEEDYALVTSWGKFSFCCFRQRREEGDRGVVGLALVWSWAGSGRLGQGGPVWGKTMGRLEKMEKAAQGRILNFQTLFLVPGLIQNQNRIKFK
jgi:hypothetical protein